MRRALAFAVILGAFAPALSFAQDATDDASNYTAGPLSFLDQGTGYNFDPINVNSLASGITAAIDAANANTISADGSINVSSQAFTLSTGSVGDNDNETGFSGFKRSLDGTESHNDGEQFRFRCHATGSRIGAGTHTVTLSNTSGAQVAVLQTGSTNWEVLYDSFTDATTIPNTSPIDVIFTFIDSTDQLSYTVQTLPSGSSYNSPALASGIAQTNFGEVDFLVSIEDDSASAQTANFAVNRLDFATAGGLPVELDSFMID